MSAEAGFALARKMRKAVRERDEAIRVACELYDEAVTQLERAESTALFLKVTREADALYEKRIFEATAEFRSAA
jgi:hypothetical protein